jgi:multidrug efflux pump subunit AcrB
MASRGIMEFFADHKVAGNLMLALMVLSGVWGFSQLNRQLLPDFYLEAINVEISWPGASPRDVEANLLEAMEAELRFIESVDKVDSTAYEGRARVSITFEEGANMSKALTDVQAAMARITTFPSDSERPVITQVLPGELVCQIELSGPFPESALKLLAQRVRNDLLNIGMAQVTVGGARDTEIWVEVPELELRRLDMTLNDVANRISAESIDLPAGQVFSGSVSRQIRSEGLARTADDLAEVEVMSTEAGEKLKLKDIASVFETFEDGAASRLIGGNPSIGLRINRGTGIDSLTAQRQVAKYIEQLQGELPATLKVRMFDVAADQVRQRVFMLLNNGLMGLVLVLIVLYLFMNVRTAFWVAAGIPVSIFAAIGVMAVLGLSLNMISMFALIMGLGIIVDDSIVVSEHAEFLHRKGASASDAAIRAAQVMRLPVFAASITTVAAFSPILTLGSTVGMIMRELPITIVLIIVASLVECFLVLPMHLRGSLEAMEKQKNQSPGRFHQAFNAFRDSRFAAASEFAFHHRYSTILATISLLVLGILMLASGRVGFDFFPSPETDLIAVNISLSPGSSRAMTKQMVLEAERAAYAVEEKLGSGKGSVIDFGFGSLGTGVGRSNDSPTQGDYAGGYTIELMPSDVRSVRTSEFMRAWEREIRPVPGLESLVVFEVNVAGPPGKDLDLRLSGAPLDVLKAAAMEIRREVARIPGVSGIADNLPYGMEEYVLEVTPEGRAMGFTTESVSRQIRNTYQGAIAKRFARDQEEILVRVRLSPEDRSTNGLQGIYLQVANGREVPLTEVVTLRSQVGFSQIRRENGLREVAITASVDQRLTTTNEVVRVVEDLVLQRVRDEFGVNAAFKGKAEEQSAALGDFGMALFLALSVIYIVLVFVFSSYSTPLVIMAMIPFGLVGAVFGHYIMGFALNIFSLQALMGLAGIMVNDSIVLVSTVKRELAAGATLAEAIHNGTKERLRPVIMTTTTTVVGLLPILFETSQQAQLIQPLAVTLVFGLLLSPFLVLFFVPALMGVGADIKKPRSSSRAQASVSGSTV